MENQVDVKVVKRDKSHEKNDFNSAREKSRRRELNSAPLDSGLTIAI